MADENGDRRSPVGGHFPLFKKHPQLQDAIPFVSLGSYPTPVEELTELSEKFDCRLWVKRDDMTSPLYGGNKVRKLEFMIAEALENHYDRIIVYGGYGSHQVLAAAIYGLRAGLEVTALLFPQPLTDHCINNLRALAGLGVTMRHVKPREMLPAAIIRERIAAIPTMQRASTMPPGGSSPLTCLGYVNAVYELKEQIARGEAPKPDVIIVALGSCGTMAGLVTGAALAKLKADIIGVRVVDHLFSNTVQVAHLCNETVKLMKKTGCRVRLRRFAPWKMSIIHDQYGGEYGLPTKKAEEAVSVFGGQGIKLETTYTAKAAAALLAALRSGRLRGKNVLFWNTYAGTDISPLAEAGPTKENLPPPFNGLGRS